VAKLLAAAEAEFEGQIEQDSLPTFCLEVLTAHGVHVPPFAPVYPALHMQLVCAALAGTDIDMGGQSRQTAEPTIAL